MSQRDYWINTSRSPGRRQCRKNRHQREDGSGNHQHRGGSPCWGAAVTIRVVTLTSTDHMRSLVAEVQELEDRLRAGGGAKKVEKQHKDGKLTARERVARLIDPGSIFLEIGLLIAHDKYD